MSPAPQEWPPILNRKQFEEACRALLHERDLQKAEDDPLRLREIWDGWNWQTYPISGYGYMHRTVTLAGRAADPGVDHTSELPEMGAQDLPETSDDPAFSSESKVVHKELTVEEDVVYHPTFQVPAFYFSVSDEAGAPVPPESIVRSPLFHFPLPLTTLDIQPHTVDLPGPPGEEDPAPIPLLTQGEHPVAGKICWYLHPCETSPAVKELLDHRGAAPAEGWELDWLKSWFVVLGRVVYLRSGAVRS